MGYLSWNKIFTQSQQIQETLSLLCNREENYLCLKHLLFATHEALRSKKHFRNIPQKRKIRIGWQGPDFLWVEMKWDRFRGLVGITLLYGL